MELQPYEDNDFYIKESRDMITIVQSLIIAGNYPFPFAYILSSLVSLLPDLLMIVFVN